MIIGIQGGPASFNDLALKDYVTRHNITDYIIKYLYTTEKVLQALDEGEIDLGQFAVHNSVGGMVKETLYAMANHRFVIVEEFGIRIQHNLMKLPTVSIDEIKVIMAHDQVLKQCTQHLTDKYPNYVQKVGEGDLIDTATAAKAISEGELPRNIFILGNPMIAELYGFETIDTNLQDAKDNITTFVIVSAAE